MTTKRENVPYTALPGAVLIGVPVSRCSHCGEYEVGIPAIDELNRALAGAVIRKRTRLVGGEIRFLRSYLGYSGADFARLIGSDPATVSRWETDKQSIGHHTDLLLRAMVALERKVDEYPITAFAEVKAEASERPGRARRSIAQRRPGQGAAPRYAFKPTAKKWKPTELSAA
jgi:putative zinc finger/helix-turn-helix YgiT family protein